MKRFLASLTLTSSLATGATIISTSPTSRVAPTDNFTTVGQSQTYFIGVAGDILVSYSNGGPNNNPTGVVMPRMRVTLTELITTDPGDFITLRGTTGQTFSTTTNGTGVSSFTMRIDYLANNGSPIIMSRRAPFDARFGPIANVLASANSSDATVDFSTLNGSGITNDPSGYTPLTDDIFNLASDDQTPDYNAGIASLDLQAAGTPGTGTDSQVNISTFNDATPLDGTDDLFSSVIVKITDADTGTFNDQAIYRMSFDSAINVIPEPGGLTLLALSAGGFVFLRRRRS